MSLRHLIYTGRRGARNARALRLWNKMLVRKWLVAAGLTALIGDGALAQGNDPSGTWVTRNARSHISISPCGPNYCGTVVRLARPHDKNGEPRRDIARLDRVQP